MNTEASVHPQALRKYADRVLEVWQDWTDEDVAEMAQETADALRRLANRIHPSKDNQ